MTSSPRTPSTLTAELAGELRRHAREMGYVFNGPIKIDFELDTRLPTGRFTVASKAVAGITERAGPASDTTISRARLVLEVNGTRHPLTPPGLVIGRGSRGRPADQRPRHLAGARPDPGQRRAVRPADRHRGPGIDQRHHRERAEGAAGRPAGGVADRDRIHPNAHPRSRRSIVAMSEIALTVIKVLFLACSGCSSCRRSRSFAATCSAGPSPPRTSPQPQELESPPPPPKKSRRQRGEPRIFVDHPGRTKSVSPLSWRPE